VSAGGSTFNAFCNKAMSDDGAGCGGYCGGRLGTGESKLEGSVRGFSALRCGQISLNGA